MPNEQTYISVISILDVLRTGDDPIKVLAEDENAYLIKHNIRGNKQKDMASEWISYWLFRHFGISVPQAELLMFDPQKFEKELSSLTGIFKRHIVFGSRWLDARDVKDDMYEGKAKSSEDLKNPEELAKILVMDLWLKNSDRQPLNLNMIVSNRKLYAIDHAAMFDQVSFIHLAQPVNKNYFVRPGEIGDLIVSSNFFRYYFKRYANEIEEAGQQLCREIEETDESFFRSVLNTMPDSWGITEEEKDAIVNYLNFRKTKLIPLFNEHINFSRQQ